jgi:transposase
MQVGYPCCCGLDVHKKSITASVLWVEARGEKRKEKRVFGTFTRDMLKLSDWLRECSVRQLARREALGLKVTVEPLAQTA